MIRTTEYNGIKLGMCICTNINFTVSWNNFFIIDGNCTHKRPDNVPIGAVLKFNQTFADELKDPASGWGLYTINHEGEAGVKSGN